MHQSYSFSVWSFHAYACTPLAARNAAMSSCVVSGLPGQAATVAPSSLAPMSRTAVSFVMCRQNPSVTPLSGCEGLRRVSVFSSIFMCERAHSYDRRPCSASFMSRTL